MRGRVVHGWRVPFANAVGVQVVAIFTGEAGRVFWESRADFDIDRPRAG